MKILRLILIIVIGLLVVGGVWWYMNDNNQTENTEEVVEYDERLSEVYVLGYGDKDDAYTVLQITKDAANDVLPEFTGRVIDYRQVGSQEVALVVTGNREELVVKNNETGEFEAIISDYKTKRRLSISQDGTHVYFTQFDQLEQEDRTQPSSWTINSYNLKTREYTVIAQGFNPQLLSLGSTGEGLLYTNDAGFSIIDLATGVEFDGLVERENRVSRSTYVTPDGKHIFAYNSLLDVYDIFKLQMADPLILTPFVLIDVNRIEAVTNSNIYFTDTEERVLAVYTIDAEPKGTDMYIFDANTNYLPFNIISR